MRGRLAILLIAVLVLPLVAIAWGGYVALRDSHAADSSDDRVSLATQATLNTAVGELHTRLKAELADLALHVSHLPPGAEGDAAAWDGVAPAQRPTLVAFVPAAGPDGAGLPRGVRLALDEDLRTERAVRGWRQLPLAGGQQLCDVVIEPRAGGSLVALRPLA